MSANDAVTSAQDICKQLLTLTTAILTLTISLLKDVLHGIHPSDLVWLRLSWLVLLVSLLFGLLTMGALTDELNKPAPSVNNSTVRTVAITHQVLFFVGVGLFTFFGAVTAYAQLPS